MPGLKTRYNYSTRSRSRVVVLAVIVAVVTVYCTVTHGLLHRIEMLLMWGIYVCSQEHCEEFGRMLQADPGKVSDRAKKRGLPQLGTLGAGNHYCEIQVVDEIFDTHAAARMGIDKIGEWLYVIL